MICTSMFSGSITKNHDNICLSGIKLFGIVQTWWSFHLIQTSQRNGKEL